MEENLQSALLTVCALLEKHDVKYILVGGTAVALNGYYRVSISIWGELTDKPDVDIWYNPTYENYFSVLSVMEELGQDVTEFRKERAPSPRSSFFRLSFENFSLDLLPEIKANIRFSEANRRKETIDVQGVKIHFLSYSDIIEDKNATAREKDLRDVENLKRLKGEQ